MFYDPVRLRTLARFSAPDPWAENQFTDYSIDDFVMLPLGSKRPAESKWSLHSVGIQWEGNFRFRLLPESLVELWKHGNVKAENLPSLLHALEPRLLETDCMTSQTWQRSVGLPLVLLVFLSPAVFLLLQVDGHRMPAALAIASGLVTAMLIGIILWSTRNAKRRRVKEQMIWAINLLAADPSAQSLPLVEDPLKVYLKLTLKFFVVFLALLLMTLCGGFVYFKFVQ